MLEYFGMGEPYIPYLSGANCSTLPDGGTPAQIAIRPIGVHKCIDGTEWPETNNSHILNQHSSQPCIFFKDFTDDGWAMTISLRINIVTPHGRTTTLDIGYVDGIFFRRIFTADFAAPEKPGKIEGSLYNAYKIGHCAVGIRGYNGFAKWRPV